MKKYKLGPRETISHGGTYVRVHRVIALIDIPAHKVKAGDNWRLGCLAENTVS